MKSEDKKKELLTQEGVELTSEKLNEVTGGSESSFNDLNIGNIGDHGFKYDRDSKDWDDSQEKPVDAGKYKVSITLK